MADETPRTLNEQRIRDLQREWHKIDRQMVAAMKATAMPYEEREAEIMKKLDEAYAAQRTAPDGGAA